MSNKLVIGYDGTETGERALTHALDLAKLIDDVEILIVYILEWSPFTFQTAEENATRHSRREHELEIAHSRVLDPTVKKLIAAGFKAEGIVRHGDVAETINTLVVENDGTQIFVGRASSDGFTKRIFGSSTQSLVMHASVPVTVVG